MTILDLTSQIYITEWAKPITDCIVHILGGNLIGIYLTGSLSFDAFDPKSSDIDLVVILNTPTSQEQIDSLRQMHMQIAEIHEKCHPKMNDLKWLSNSHYQSYLGYHAHRAYLKNGFQLNCHHMALKLKKGN